MWNLKFHLSESLDAVLLAHSDMTNLDCHVSSTKRGVFVDENVKMSLLSTKRGVFVDRNGKIGVPSMKRAVFVDGSPGYLHDLNENIN